MAMLDSLKEMTCDLLNKPEKRVCFVSSAYEIMKAEATYFQIADACIEEFKKDLGDPLWRGHFKNLVCNCPNCVRGQIYNIVSFCNENRTPARFTKQVSSRFKLEMSFDFRPFEERFGNIISQYKSPTKGLQIFYDFADDFNWKDGMFGKSDSCWWTCYSCSRDTFKKNGGYGIRIYSSHTDKKGIGRCWIYPIAPDAFILFNAYGLEMRTFKSILFNIFGVENSTEVEFYNYDDSNHPYVNRQEGLLIWEGDFSKHANTRKHIVHWAKESGIYTNKCRHCGDIFHIDESEGVDICQNCYDNQDDDEDYDEDHDLD